MSKKWKGVLAVSAAFIVLFASGRNRDMVYADTSKEVLVGNDVGKLVLDEKCMEIEVSKEKRYGNIFAPSYDPREKGKVTSVKNQGSADTCWAFSTMAAMESAAIRQGLADNTIDLSENHFAYFFYHRQNDPLGLTAGDKNLIKDKSKNYLMNGGSTWMASYALATWSGAALEQVSPYLISPNYNGGHTVSINIPAHSLAYQNEWIVKNAYFLSNDSPTVDVQEVKNAIVQWGGVAAGYLHSSVYYNEGTGAYSSPKTGGNHAVAIVGWDDNYKKENFSSASNVKKDGAWIAKNSWGEEWGDKGYFYLSYEDKSVGNMVAYQLQSPSTYQHNYQYDGSAVTGYMEKLDYGTKVANIFRAKGSKSGMDEIISAVGLNLWETDVNYSVQIYRNLKDLSNPCSGTKVFATEKKGKTNAAGIFTIELGQEVTVANGEYYSVVITLKKPGGTSVGIEYSSDSISWFGIQAQIDQNQSFVYENGRWMDVAKYLDPYTYERIPICFRVKAYTNDGTTRSVRSIALNKQKAILYKGQSLQLSSDIRPVELSGSKVTWSSSNPKVATVDEKGRVTAKNTGKANIQAAVRDAAGTKTAVCTITVEEKVNLSKVTGWKSSSQKAGRVDFSWKSQKGADGYVLYYKTSAGGQYKRLHKIVSGKKTVFSKTGLKKGKKYYFKIKAFKKANGKIYYSEDSSVIMVVVRLNKVTGIKKLQVQKTRIKIGWKKNSNASGYIVYFRAEKDGQYQKCKTITNKNKLFCTKGNLKRGKTYYFKIKAYKTIGGSKYFSSDSKVLKVKTKK